MMDEFVEVDPTGRYGRYNEILGKGASKIVYRAFDEYEGIEVAWNQVKLNDLLRRPEDLERLYSEIHLLKTLEHKHIMKFYTSWVDASKRNINFVTELFTSGTLRQYRQKHKKVNIRAVKHWCRQILKGLVYLHSHDPPIIHRDLKCDNIFINGNQGLVKIGDLGLAAILRKSHAHCVGTPEFMAPEVYEEEYNELVDIYSFGMCVLEMVTFEYPYSECFHPVQIYKKVISGTKPQALYRIDDREVRQFIEKCLATASERLSAKELLKDPFLLVDGRCSTYQEGDISEMCQILRQPYFDLCSSGALIANSDDFLHHETKMEKNSEMSQNFHSRFYRNDSLFSNGFLDGYMHETMTANEWDYSAPDSRIQGINLFSSDEGAPFDDLDITIKGTRREDGRIFLRIRITDQEGHVRNIHFPFDIDSDTAFNVATEMIRELDITNCDVPRIAGMINGEVSSVMSECKPGLYTDVLDFAETPFYDNQVSDDSLRDSLLDYLPTYAPGLTSRQSGHFSGLEHAATHNGFEESTYQVEGSEQCLTEGAPALSSCQSEALDLRSHGSRENHSDEERTQLNQAVNIEKEVRENSQTGRIECAVPLHSSYISELRYESSSGNTADDHENKTSQELGWFKLKDQMESKDNTNQQMNGRRSLNPSPDFGNTKSGMENGVVSSSRAPSKTSPEKSKSSFRLGKRFTFNFPPRRNLIPPDRNFTDSITRLTCSSTPVSSKGSALLGKSC